METLFIQEELLSHAGVARVIDKSLGLIDYALSSLATLGFRAIIVFSGMMAGSAWISIIALLTMVVSAWRVAVRMARIAAL